MINKTKAFCLITLTQLMSLALGSVSQAKSLPQSCQHKDKFYQQRHFGAAKGDSADYVFVDKARRMIHLFQEGLLIKSYRIGLGNTPVGAKQKAGDGKTPEGSYIIDSRNSGSNYHLALHISYPNQEDLDLARSKGIDPGGAIMVHGLPNEKWKKAFIRHPSDWTKGCVAVKDAEIEEIWDMVSIGTPIDLCP